MRYFNIAGVLCLTALPLSAPRAQSDWFARLYTNEGVELRADERLFTLYAALNAMGYDEAPLLRELPVPAREMHPVRGRVRSSVRLEASEEAELNSFFDSHPLPAETYSRWAVTLGGPPKFERSGTSEAGGKGLETLLEGVWTRHQLGGLFASAQDEYRASLKSYLAVVDAPIGAVRRLLKQKEDEAPRVVLLVNLLDARGKAFSAQSPGELTVVLGPSRSPDLFSVAREVARSRIEPLVVAGLPRPKTAPAAGAKSREGPAPRHDSGQAWFATEALSRAFAAAALNLPESELEAWTQGEFGRVREIAKSVEAFANSDKPLEPFVAAWLGRITRGD